MDESLTWKDYINRISKKISGGIGGLKRVRHLVPFEILLTICITHLYYRISDKLQKLQNRAARVVTFSNYNRQSELLDELMCCWMSLCVAG